jgi:hypothetical protein
VDSVAPVEVAPPALCAGETPASPAGGTPALHAFRALHAPPAGAVEAAQQRMSFETAAALVLLVLDLIALAVAYWGP